MWPWEHLAFGYVCYALYRRARDGRGPDHGEAVALAVGTQFPDLIDKPLAWEFGVLPSGVSLAHSALFAAPLILAVVAVARRRGAGPPGVAFGAGYLSHLAGDILYPLAVSGGLPLGFLLWPLVPAAPGTEPFATRIPELWARFGAFLGTPRGRLYLAGEAVLLSFALGLWLRDGAPGLPWRRGQST